MPLLRDTITLIPVSMKGTEKSITSDLSSLMVSEPTAMRAFFATTCGATADRPRDKAKDSQTDLSSVGIYSTKY